MKLLFRDALEMARRDEDLVYFRDSQAAIKVVLRWVGEGAKTNREVDKKNTEANLQMARTEKREATIKMERRSAKIGTSTGSTASSHGRQREKKALKGGGESNGSTTRG